MAFGAGVKASVDTVEVVEGNAVQLYLKATGGVAEFPTIDAVGDAPIVGRSGSSSHNLSIINGAMQQEQSTTQILQFVPKQSMTIPSYAVKIDDQTYKTEPIEIKVVKASVSLKNNHNPFYLEMQTKNTQVSVGESFAVTVYFALKNDVRLSGDVQYTPPTFTGFTVSNEAQKQPYMKAEYRIQEVQYILTPQAEGNYTITPAGAAIGLTDRNTRDIFGMGFGTSWKHITSNALQIEVLPQAKQSDLLGDFTLDSSIDTQVSKANKPVNLSVTIEGKGSLENFEFPKYDIDGVTVYTDEAKRETSVQNGELHSKYTKSFAFISEEDFTIPERTFSVLVPGENALKTLKVKAYEITIKSKVKTQDPSEAKPSHTVVQSNTEHPQEVKKEVLVEPKTERTSLSWWMLVIAFVLGALLMGVLRQIPKGMRTKTYTDEEALKRLYAHVSEDPAVEEMVRKLYAKKRGDKSVQIDKKALKQMLDRFG
jgi:hypothetical protein